MDKIDQKLFKELDINPKITTSKLAKKIKISQQVANYRLKQLLKPKIKIIPTEDRQHQARLISPAHAKDYRTGFRQITKFGTIINLKSLGLEHYRIFFTFNRIKDHKKIFEYLKNKKGIYWAARIGGRYDLLVVLHVKDFEEFDRFIDDFNTKFPDIIKDYKSCYGIDQHIYKHKFLSKDYSSLSYGYNDKIVQIDELDHYILTKIKDDCRLSALELAKNQDVSYKTIINRIRNMEAKKVILGYRLFIKEEQNSFIVLFSFKDYSKKDEKRLISYLAHKDEITQTIKLFGIWNLFLHIRTEDNEQLQALVIELRNKFKIIDNYEIIPVFEDIAINLMPI